MSELCCSIAHPLVFGDYPDVMKKNAGSRLLAFSNQKSELLKSSFDFLGVIHYFTSYVKDNSDALKSENRDLIADMAAKIICMFLTNHYWTC